METRSLNPKGIAKPFGPFAQVTSAPPGGTLICCSGAVATDESGEVVGVGDIVAQTHQVMRNLQIALEATGATFGDVIKINSYITDADLYPKVAPVRQQYLAEPYPASTLVEVQRLIYPELLIEIEAVAVRYELQR